MTTHQKVILYDAMLSLAWNAVTEPKHVLTQSQLRAFDNSKHDIAGFREFGAKKVKRRPIGPF